MLSRMTCTLLSTMSNTMVSTMMGAQKKQRTWLATAMVAGVLALLPWQQVSAQLVRGDTTFTPQTALHSPQGALWRSAAVPGWGQIYNKQYVKLPFVYGALGYLVYQAASSHNDYVLYREAFQYKAWQELVDSGQADENPKIGFKDSYDVISAEFGSISSRPLENQRNNFRRSRDLSVVGVGLVYGLAMLDAFVSAHLLDFDVGEDLNFQVSPAAGGFRLSARFHLGLSE